MATVVAPSSSTSTQSHAVQHPYTCNTCQVAFRGSELQRSHMQSDWHRYNLKRRVASLPPLTSEIFAEKVLANQASAAATAARASFEKICAVCQRTYFSENAYQNHLGSQKHKLRLMQMQSETTSVTDIETASMMSSAFSLGESIDTTPAARPAIIEDPVVQEEFEQVVDGIKNAAIEEDEDPLPRRPSRPHYSAASDRPEHPLSPIKSQDSAAVAESDTQADVLQTHKCLFCNLESADLEANVAHMRNKHGLYIPEKEFLVDLDGLVGWFWERVGTLHECLYCGQVKHTTSGIQTHMRDKGHCMIAFESEVDMIEVGQFYDFSSTYSDDEEDAEDVSDEEWEDDEDAADAEEMSVDGDDTASVPESDRTAKPSRRTGRAVVDDFELHLPSGRTAGHRHLARYFRQNLHSYPTPAERQARLAITAGGADPQDSRAAEADGRGRQVVTRANGGLGLASAPEALRKAAQVKEMKQVRKAQRIEKQYQWGVDKKGNNQKHFRDPLLQ